MLTLDKNDGRILNWINRFEVVCIVSTSACKPFQNNLTHFIFDWIALNLNLPYFDSSISKPIISFCKPSLNHFCLLCSFHFNVFLAVMAAHRKSLKRTVSVAPKSTQCTYSNLLVANAVAVCDTISTKSIARIIGHTLRKIDNIVVKQRIIGRGSNLPWLIASLTKTSKKYFFTTSC